MYAASYRSSPDRRRRAISLALTILAHVLIALLLLLLPNSPLTRMGPSSALTTFDVSSSGSPSPSKAQAKKRAAAAPRGGAPEVRPQPTPPQDQPVPPPPEVIQNNMLVMDRESFAATDVGKIKGKKSARELAAAGDANGDSGDAGSGNDTPGAGRGPGGQQLFAADWYVRPPRTALTPYMPHHDVPAGSWGEIACRTVANYRVEDCVQLGDSQPGLGVSRAMREAAWQFRIMPPRLNGKPQIGTWVRIHYDIVDKGGDLDG